MASSTSVVETISTSVTSNPSVPSTPSLSKKEARLKLKNGELILLKHNTKNKNNNQSSTAWDLIHDVVYTLMQ